MPVLQDFDVRRCLKKLPLPEHLKNLAEDTASLLDSEGRVSMLRVAKMLRYDDAAWRITKLQELRTQIERLSEENQLQFSLKLPRSWDINLEAQFLCFEGLDDYLPAVRVPHPEATPLTENIASDIDSDARPVAVLLTFNEHEAHKVWDTFGRSRRELLMQGVTYSELDEVGGFRVIHGHSSQQGPLEAQLSAANAIEHWRPEVLIAVGIAFGVKEEKHHIGDVLVSTGVLDYESARVEPDDTFTPRGITLPTSRELANRVTNLNLRREQVRDLPTIHMGTIVSGAKLVDNKEYRDNLASLHSTVIGGEMEGSGILTACKEKKVDVIVIKAICDWAAHKNNPSKEDDQKKASKNAAIVARAILERGHLQNETAKQRRRLRELENPTSSTPPFPDVLKMGEHDEVLEEERLIRDSRASAVDLDPKAALGIPAQGTSVVDAMLDWVSNPTEPRLFALLGEYGMGKTVSCQRFIRELAERRKADPTLPMPLYFDLKNVADARLADRLEDLVVTCMHRAWLPKHSSHHTWQAFTSWLAAGPCVVVFDGLDEMLVKLDNTQGLSFLSRLLDVLQLLDDEDANRQIRLVLSCRTQYFKTLNKQRSAFPDRDRENRNADSYRTMTLLPLGDDQIHCYLEIALPGSDIARIMELVASVHNLPELAARPFSLKLIAEHIPEIERARASGKPVFGATLYKAMVERWLARDEGKHFIDPEHKSAFMAELAAWLWREKKTAAPAKDVETIFRRWIRSDEDLNDIYPSTLTKSDKDKLNEDLRTATFLARQDDKRGSTFHFAHTSLQEYFLACYLLDAIQRDDRSRWAMRTPSAETLDFLGQLLAEAQDPELIDTLSSWKTPYLEQASELLLRYTFAARKQDYPAPNLARIDLSGAHLDDWDFLGTPDNPLNLAEANFTTASLRRTAFSHTNLAGAHFAKATLNQATFHNCTTRHTTWHDAPHPGAAWQTPILSIPTGMETGFYPGHTSAVTGVAWRPDGDLIATTSHDHTCIIWNPHTAEKLITLTGHTDVVTGVTWHPDGTRLATASWDGTGIVWDSRTGHPITTLAGHTDWVTGIAWHPNGSLIATTSHDACIIWDPHTAQKLTTLTKSDWVTGIAWHPNGSLIATTSHDRTCIIWNPHTAEKLTTLTGHTFLVTGVAWHPDGDLLATTSTDHTCIIWNPHTAEKHLTLTGHTNWVTGAAWHPDDTRLATVSRDGTCIIWDPHTGQKLITLTSHTREVTGVAWHPDGDLLATTSWDHTCIIWNPHTAKKLTTITDHTDVVTGVAWHPTGNLLATTSWDHTCIIWNHITAKKLTTLTDHTDMVTGVAWHPTGSLLATASADRTCIIWNPHTAEKLTTLTSHTREVTGVAWHPDGDLLATTNWDCTCIIWNPHTAKKLITLTGHTDVVTGVAWSPDGTHLATTSSDRTCIIWNHITGEKLITLTDHTGGLIGVAWHPSGDLLATASADRTCIIWNPHTAEKLTTLTGHTRAVTGLAWHPTGDLIATADASGLIRISHLDGTLERAFISVRPRVPGVESYASWTSEGLDVLEGEAWRVLRIPEPGGGSRRLELPGLSYEPPTD